MSHQDWQGPLFDPPQVRREAAQRIKVEHPPGIEIRQVVAPPAPDGASRRSYGDRLMPRRRRSRRPTVSRPSPG